MENSKIYVVSDIHGELDRLKNLFEKLSIGKNDTLVFLGDYIDRGADSKGVIDYLLELDKKYDCVFLKGNHEDMAIQAHKELFRADAWSGGQSSQAMGSWLMNGGMQCLDSYNKLGFAEAGTLQNMFETHGHFFKKLQVTYETENFIFVHGFLGCNVDPTEASEFLCLWGRYKDIQPHCSGKTVVCGHSIQRDGPSNHGYKICIDTGGFLADGYITCMVIDGLRIKFIDSR